MTKKMVVLPVCRMGRGNKWEVFDMAFPVDNILRIENICPGWSEGGTDDEPLSEIHFKDSEITFFLLVNADRAADLINND